MVRSLYLSRKVRNLDFHMNFPSFRNPVGIDQNVSAGGPPRSGWELRCPRCPQCLGTRAPFLISCFQLPGGRLGLCLPWWPLSPTFKGSWASSAVALWAVGRAGWAGVPHLGARPAPSSRSLGQAEGRDLRPRSKEGAEASPGCSRSSCPGRFPSPSQRPLHPAAWAGTSEKPGRPG